MKKFLGFIMTAVFMTLPLVLSGCSDDEEENVFNITAADIVGTWRCVSSHILCKENGKVVQDDVDKEIGSIMVITQSGNKQEGIVAGTDSDGYFNNVLWKLEKGIFYTCNEDELEDGWDDFMWIPFKIKDFTGDRMTLLCEETYNSKEGPYNYSVYIYIKNVLERVK